MNEIQIFSNSEFGSLQWYEQDGVLYFNLEQCARGLGFTKTEIKDGKEYSSVRWSRVNEYLSDFGFSPINGRSDFRKNFPNGFSQQVGKERFIPENIFYRLAMKAKNETAERFQSWIADKVVPSIRKYGSYGVKKENPALPSGILEGAKIIFESAGIKGNQLALALDKTAKHYTGESMLALGGIQLEVETKRQALTPSEIGAELGISGRRVNEILAGAGFQHKIADKWEPLEPGMPYAVMIDTGRKHNDGTPIRQLKWDSSVIKEIAA